MHRLLHRHLDRASAGGCGHRHAWRKIGLGCLGLTLLIGLIVWAGYTLQDHIPAIEDWLEAQGAWAPVIFIAIFVLCSIFCFPADIFIFIAGALFGLWFGYLYVIIAACFIMLLDFYIGRHVIKARVESFMARHPKFNAIDRAVGERGLKIAFLLRLGPVPLSPLSYILAVSRISFRNYLLSSPGALLSFFAWAYYGNLAAHLTKLAAGLEHHSTGHYVSMAIGAVIAVVTMVYVTHVARNALREANAL